MVCPRLYMVLGVPRTQGVCAHRLLSKLMSSAIQEMPKDGPSLFLLAPTVNPASAAFKNSTLTCKLLGIPFKDPGIKASRASQRQVSVEMQLHGNCRASQENKTELSRG